MDHIIKNPLLGLVDTLAALAGHHGKRYCYPSQAKIIELHARRTKRQMSRATLNRHLLAIERQGYIKRTRRHRAGPYGMELHSTLYEFTRRAVVYLRSAGDRLVRWFALMGSIDTRLPCLSPEAISALQKQSHRGGPLRGPPPQR